MTRLILASGSPRRAELLGLLGLPFEVRPPQIDESRYPDEEPRHYVERLARLKASAHVPPGAIVLGGDTVVVHRGRILGKPSHPAEARTMLERLSAETHQVWSGVAVAAAVDGRPVVESVAESATVRLLSLTDEEISAYLDTGEPLDKAGAYALQGRGALLVESIEGHPTTVVGLPLPAVRRLLSRVGIQVL